MYGCEACLAGELIEFSDGSLGLALNLESQTIGAVRFASSFWGTNLHRRLSNLVRTTQAKSLTSSLEMRTAVGS